MDFQLQHDPRVRDMFASLMASAERNGDSWRLVSDLHEEPAG
ncbi:MAG: hypothetical protein RML46_06525 [Anaerolineae bacterium]|nr:hypothetical protein [Anaerolineae bacterium]